MPKLRCAALLAAGLIGVSGCGGTDDDTAQASPAAGPPTDQATAAATSPPAETAAEAPAPTPAADDAQLVELSVIGGDVSGDTGRVEIPLGAQVRLTVTSDTADELHVHGFDLVRDLPPGQAVQLEFVADQPGVFEVELHDARRVLTRLQVS
jgi:hypothetical protein